ncbi:hypothetical protein FJ970_33485 (plasmid) [Mesorhizobium sp. B2-1-8]|uniref:hypothetical protein n=1 Tax=Mesorhizobium sp. B2-1-8 TaxID=2589967 RepID=UPI00112C51A6|nr:hypothetical protein [Mesorhizobium sp. B2-1-8]UCI22823.1 hypothetical protein FJ970_33485 [Mesorhizobium sp. B2-1-8]
MVAANEPAEDNQARLLPFEEGWQRVQVDIKLLAQAGIILSPSLLPIGDEETDSQVLRSEHKN